jgi:hypothetical protein
MPPSAILYHCKHVCEVFRRAILQRYAKQLSEAEIAALADAAAGMSGRDLRDICEQAERRWASKVCQASLKPLGYSWSYLACKIGHLRAG